MDGRLPLTTTMTRGRGEEGRTGMRFSADWMTAVLVLVGLLALPVGRPDSQFLTLDPELYALAVGGPLLWVLLLATAATLVLSLLPLRTARRADAVLVTAGVAFLSLLLWLALTSTPFGMGALVALVGLTLALGVGLSEGGHIQGDPFIAASILFVSGFVLLFIVYPLYTVLKGAVWNAGRFDLTTLVATLRHPLFFVLDNRATPVDEAVMALRFGLVGVGLGTLWGALRRSRIARVGLSALGMGFAGFLLGVRVYGRGALPTSLAVVLIVAPTCTLLGLAFALLGQRA